MKVILKSDVKKLGKSGDVINVKDGYATNFLIPNKLAVLADPSGLKNLENVKSSKAASDAIELQKVQDMITELDKADILVPIKIGKDGAIFSGVNAIRIAAVLKGMGHDVDKKSVHIDKPIKELGEHDVLLKFPHNLETTIRINIVAEKDK